MRASDVTVEWLRENLSGFEGSNGQYYAWCPVHADEGTSEKGLSITVKGKRILCKCHSPHCGATLVDVIRAIEGGEHSNGHVKITKHSSNPSSKGKKHTLSDWAEYTHVEESIWKQLGVEELPDGIAFTFTGSDVIKIRKAGKDYEFRPRGRLVSPLWPIPAGSLPEHISITEGESDCGTTYAAGLPMGFSVTKGSDTPLSTETFQALAQQGVQQVTFYSDADKSGNELRQRVVKHATDAGLIVHVCDISLITQPWWPIKDLNELWKEVDDLKEFQKLVKKATYEVAQTRPVMDLDEIEEEASKDVDWLIPNLLATSDKAMIWGYAKSMKTWITLDLVRALCTQQAFLSRDEWTSTREHNVLLVEEEGNITLFAKRVKRLQMNGNKNFHLMHRKGFTFVDEEAVASIIGTCRDLDIEVVIFDPLQRMIPGLKENEAPEMGVVWDAIARIQQACPGIVVLIVHHSNKSDASGWTGQRGSSRHAGEVDLGLSIEKHPDEDDTLSIWVDGRDMPHSLRPGESLKCKVTITEDSFTANAQDIEVRVSKNQVQKTRDTNYEAVLAAVEDGNDTRTKIMRATNLSDVTVRKHLARLVEENLVNEREGEAGRPNIYTAKEEDDG